MESGLSEVFEYPFTIRESHLDTFGHVNNAAYFVILEEARWEIIAARGFVLDQVQRSGVGPTILTVQLQFRRELRNRDKILIRTWVTEIKRLTMGLRQVMINEKGEEAAIADFVIGLFDLNARKLIEPTPEWKHALGLKP